MDILKITKTCEVGTMKILVFTEGTVIMLSVAKGANRRERVKQAKKAGSSIHKFRSYIPNDKAVEKLTKWQKQGAQIYYLTSRTITEEIDDICFVLNKYGFPDKKNLLFRQKNEDYKDVAEKLTPDILIEDDCESIGGEAEMTYPHIKPELQKKIKSIVVKEFGGIDHLPDNARELTAAK